MPPPAGDDGRSTRLEGTKWQMPNTLVNMCTDNQWPAAGKKHLETCLQQVMSGGMSVQQVLQDFPLAGGKFHPNVTQEERDLIKTVLTACKARERERKGVQHELLKFGTLKKYAIDLTLLPDAPDGDGGGAAAKDKNPQALRAALAAEGGAGMEEQLKKFPPQRDSAVVKQEFRDNDAGPIVEKHLNRAAAKIAAAKKEKLEAQKKEHLATHEREQQKMAAIAAESKKKEEDEAKERELKELRRRTADQADKVERVDALEQRARELEVQLKEQQEESKRQKEEFDRQKAEFQKQQNLRAREDAENAAKEEAQKAKEEAQKAKVLEMLNHARKLANEVGLPVTWTTQKKAKTAKAIGKEAVEEEEIVSRADLQAALRATNTPGIKGRAGKGNADGKAPATPVLNVTTAKTAGGAGGGASSAKKRPGRPPKTDALGGGGTSSTGGASSGRKAKTAKVDYTGTKQDLTPTAGHKESGKASLFVRDLMAAQPDEFVKIDEDGHECVDGNGKRVMLSAKKENRRDDKTQGVAATGDLVVWVGDLQPVLIDKGKHKGEPVNPEAIMPEDPPYTILDGGRVEFAWAARHEILPVGLGLNLQHPYQKYVLKLVDQTPTQLDDGTYEPSETARFEANQQFMLVMLGLTPSAEWCEPIYGDSGNVDEDGKPIMVPVGVEHRRAFQYGSIPPVVYLSGKVAGTILSMDEASIEYDEGANSVQLTTKVKSKKIGVRTITGAWHQLPDGVGLEQLDEAFNKLQTAVKTLTAGVFRHDGDEPVEARMRNKKEAAKLEEAAKLADSGNVDANGKPIMVPAVDDEGKPIRVAVRTLESGNMRTMQNSKPYLPLPLLSGEEGRESSGNALCHSDLFVALEIFEVSVLMILTPEEVNACLRAHGIQPVDFGDDDDICEEDLAEQLGLAQALVDRLFKDVDNEDSAYVLRYPGSTTAFMSPTIPLKEVTQRMTAQGQVLLVDIWSMTGMDTGPGPWHIAQYAFKAIITQLEIGEVVGRADGNYLQGLKTVLAKRSAAGHVERVKRFFTPQVFSATLEDETLVDALEMIDDARHDPSLRCSCDECRYHGEVDNWVGNKDAEIPERLVMQIAEGLTYNGTNMVETGAMPVPTETVRQMLKEMWVRIPGSRKQ